MHFNIILPFNVLLFYLIISNNFYANGEKSYLRFRNSILRIYIASDKNRFHIINDYSKKIIQKIKNKVTNKYYDLNLFYNSLSDEEKEFIDFIISLCY